ncbi:DinI-like family protein [Morganella morganii]|uniref:DinI-like family protein n=1 Tax=Morganella morganii TaxID=582 RepID=UPI000A276400|nr:protein impC [Morganella phage IME1369_02]ELJ5776633.1 DinI-like family protein [Morganella morganii]
MLRIDVIFSSNQKEMVPPGTFEALEKEIDRKLRAQYQDMNVRIAWGTNASMSVTGGKNDKDNKKIKEIVQEIFEDGSWVPEMVSVSGDINT